MNLTTNFTLEELTVSQDAARAGIAEQFDPPEEILNNLHKLASSLEVVRALLGSVPILVSSGYRCPALERILTKADFAHWCANRSLPVDDTSWALYLAGKAHPLGLAADFTAPRFGTPIDVCRRVATTTHLEFDQVIFEYGRWCHFGVGPGTRRQALSKFAGDSVYHVGILEHA